MSAANTRWLMASLRRCFVPFWTITGQGSYSVHHRYLCKNFAKLAIIFCCLSMPTRSNAKTFVRIQILLPWFRYYISFNFPQVACCTSWAMKGLGPNSNPFWRSWFSLLWSILLNGEIANVTWSFCWTTMWSIGTKNTLRKWEKNMLKVSLKVNFSSRSCRLTKVFTYSRFQHLHVSILQIHREPWCGQTSLEGERP